MSVLPAGCVSDDPRDEEEDEDSDIPGVHCTRLLLRPPAHMNILVTKLSYMTFPVPANRSA